MAYEMMMLSAATAGLLVAMLVTLARAIAGPSVYDRVLAVNSVGTKIVLLIAVMGFISGRPDFLDIALLYALVNFIGTLAVLKFFRYRHLGGTGESRTVPAKTESSR
jgi:multicomponent Na+:H+ antiporter subunit F